MQNPESLPETPPTPDLRARAGLFNLFALFDRMPGIAAITDTEGGLIYVNAAGRGMMDLGRTSSLKGESILDHYAPQSRELLRKRVFPAAIRNGVWCGETALAGDHGQPIPLWQITVFHRDAGPQGGLMSTLAWDFSSHKDMERNLWHQATHDALTGLPNRALLMDRLVQAIHAAQRTPYFTAVLLMDVDGFKAINDGYGHETGNQLLAELAVRLYGCVRACDTVGRYGGDEFVFILCELKVSNEVEQVITRIRTALAAPFVIGERTFHVGASIGVAIHPDHGDDATSLLQHADKSMYRAKRNHGPQRHGNSVRLLHSLGPTVNCDVELSLSSPTLP